MSLNQNMPSSGFVAWQNMPSSLACHAPGPLRRLLLLTLKHPCARALHSARGYGLFLRLSGGRLPPRAPAPAHGRVPLQQRKRDGRGGSANIAAQPVVSTPSSTTFHHVPVRCTASVQPVPESAESLPADCVQISCANYEARALGVSADMRIADAKRLCPEILVVPYLFDQYQVRGGDPQEGRGGEGREGRGGEGRVYRPVRSHISPATSVVPTRQ